ncbi:hypothetical protein Fmac_020939 [Flemingia macrophylla]|uniref:ATPase AAA-type core domain-containing protein n=1 Tax=Flemingia macrophylla TaxID=520843 RepID=A0ABD1LVN9_9FABA
MAGSRSSSNNGLPLAKVKQQWPILGGREDQISMVKRALKNRANILLHGPGGCGKTMFVHAIANETAQPFYELLGKAIPGILIANYDLLSLITSIYDKGKELTRYVHCVECQVETLKKGDVHEHRVSM